MAIAVTAKTTRGTGHLCPQVSMLSPSQDGTKEASLIRIARDTRITLYDLNIKWQEVKGV